MPDTFTTDRVTWVWDSTALNRLYAALDQADEVAWDLETTGLDEFKPNAKITMVSLTFLRRDQNWRTDEPDTWIVPLYHGESPWLGSWRIVYRSIATRLVGKYLIAHNGKFDCRYTFAMTGVNLSTSMQWDSDASSHLLDENRSRKLKFRAVETFGIANWAEDIEMDPEVGSLLIPLFDLGWYAARDTYWTWKLAMNHRYRMFVLDPEFPPDAPDEYEDARLGRLMTWVVQPSVRTLARMEMRGIKLDVPWVHEQIEADTGIRDEHFEWLTSRYPEFGPENASFAPTSTWWINYAAHAVDKGDLRVIAMTGTGKPKWSKEVLVRLERMGSETAKRLLIYRRAVKRLEYLYSWLEELKPDGLIHTNYNVGTTITGRLSSDSPNMQQITKMLRPAYVPRPGYVIADFDYSQIEMRVFAQVAHCIPMIQAFIEGRDTHSMLAGRITGKDPQDVTPDERQGAKPGNFGFLFGQTAFGFKFYAENVYDISFTDEECQEIYDAFFALWEGAADFHSKTIVKAHREGQVVSPLGRVRRLPGIHGAGEKHAENAALNAPIQSMASDLLMMAAASIEGVLPGHDPVEGVSLVATVHDSLVAELPADDWERAAHEVIERMTQGVLRVLERMDVHLEVPLAAECTVGTRWGLKDVGEVA